MELRILDNNKIIRRKNILEVTNFNLSGPGSLFDPNIFGQGEKKYTQYGYIKLNGHFIHPLFYDMSNRLWRDLSSIVNGSKKFKIDNTGDLIPDENGDTGLDWLYTNFDKINLSKLKVSDKNKEDTKKMKMAYSKLTRDNFFVDKWLVMPQHFRDLDTSDGNIKVDELNQFYIDLIKATTFKARAQFSTAWNDSKIQGLLVSLFKHLQRHFDKRGQQNKAVMGRTVDNAVIMVIVAPEVRLKDKIGEGRYTLDKITIPLHQFLSASPIQAITATIQILRSFYNSGKIEGITEDQFNNYFTDEFVSEALSTYVKSRAERVRPVSTPNGNPIMLYYEFTDDTNKKVTKGEKPLVWVELFYLAAQVYKDYLRAVLVRYPVTEKGSNLFFTATPSVFTQDEGDVKIFLNKGDTEPIYQYEDNFPNTFIYNPSSTTLDRVFDETARMSNLLLSTLGADYDGDTVNIKFLYSKEARDAVDKIKQKPQNLLNLDGSCEKTIEKEGLQGLYNLTKSKYGLDTTSRNKEAENELMIFFKNKRIPSLGELLSLIDKYNIEDTVQWHGTYTTIGRVIFNEIVFSKIDSHKFINDTMTSSTLSKIINDYASLLIVKKINIEQFKSILNTAHDLGFGVTDIVSPGISTSMLVKEDKIFDKKMEEVYNKVKDKIEIDKDPSAMKVYEDEMIEFSKEHYKNNPMTDLYNSGAGPKWGVDWKNMKISMGILPDPGTGKVSLVKNNLKTGMNNDEIITVANLQIHGAYSRAKDVALGGHIVSRLIAAYQSLIGYKTDCGCNEYLETIDEERSDLLYRYIKNEKGGDDIFITLDNIHKYLNKPIKKRSPIFCKHKEGICSKCLGELIFLMTDEDKANIGLYVPIIGTTLLKAYMKATHDMGAKLFKINNLDDYIE